MIVLLQSMCQPCYSTPGSYAESRGYRDHSLCRMVGDSLDSYMSGEERIVVVSVKTNWQNFLHITEDANVGAWETH